MKTSLYRTATGMFYSASMALAVMLATGCAQSGDSFKVERKTVNGLPSITATGTSWANVKIDSVDPTTRTIGLAGSDGKAALFVVSPAVRNFAQIKKGDVVRVEYFDQIAANVHKVNEPAARGEVSAMELAPLGAKPGIVATRIVEIQANVEAIDYAGRTVTLKGVSGDPYTLNVDKRVKSFDKVQKGDQVVFTYSEAISITVAKP